MKNIFKTIWGEYRKRYSLYSGITAGIFLLQIIHLYWLTTHVIWPRLFGVSLFDPSPFWQFTIVIVDYFEIPAIISTSFLYIYALSKNWNKKDLWLLILLNTQWIHILWITDEFVETSFVAGATATLFPFWLAWIAIFIDYLELPVMYDTTKKFFQSLGKKAPKEPQE